MAHPKERKNLSPYPQESHCSSIRILGSVPPQSPVQVWAAWNFPVNALGSLTLSPAPHMPTHSPFCPFPCPKMPPSLLFPTLTILPNPCTGLERLIKTYPARAGSSTGGWCKSLAMTSLPLCQCERVLWYFCVDIGWPNLYWPNYCTLGLHPLLCSNFKTYLNGNVLDSSSTKQRKNRMNTRLSF